MVRVATAAANGRSAQGGEGISMVWTWRLEQPDGSEVTDSALTQPQHSNQSDAESWLGEQWRELSNGGVAQVTLLDGDTVVYGPMPLSEQ